MINQTDQLLKRYGTRGAVNKDHPISVKIVNDELSQLMVISAVLLSIFLAMSMFILNLQLMTLDLVRPRAYGRISEG